MNQGIRDRIVKVFCECCQSGEVYLEETEALELESVDILEFVLGVEDEFGIEYDDFAELSLHMETLGDLLDFLTGIVEQRGE